MREPFSKTTVDGAPGLAIFRTSILWPAKFCSTASAWAWPLTSAIASTGRVNRVKDMNVSSLITVAILPAATIRYRQIATSCQK
jgi:hypothetical protein